LKVVETALKMQDIKMQVKKTIISTQENS